jgi:hypothetical protein
MWQLLHNLIPVMRTVVTYSVTYCVKDLCHWAEDKGWLQSEREVCSHAQYLEMVPV